MKELEQSTGRACGAWFPPSRLPLADVPLAAAAGAAGGGALCLFCSAAARNRRCAMPTWRWSSKRDGRAGWRRHVPPALMLAALTLAAAGHGAAHRRWSACRRSRATVMLAMDVSGSMRATDVKPSRIDGGADRGQGTISRTSPRMCDRHRRLCRHRAAGAEPHHRPAGAERGHRPFRIAARHRGGQRHPGGAVHAVPAGGFPDQPVQFRQFRRLWPLRRRLSISASALAGVALGERATAAAQESMCRSSRAPTRMRWSILLTDGQTNAGYDPIEAARIA